MHASVRSCLYVCASPMHLVLMEIRKGHWIPRSWSYSWEPNRGPLEELQMLLTPDPSLHPLELFKVAAVLRSFSKQGFLLCVCTYFTPQSCPLVSLSGLLLGTWARSSIAGLLILPGALSDKPVPGCSPLAVQSPFPRMVVLSSACGALTVFYPPPEFSWLLGIKGQ